MIIDNVAELTDLKDRQIRVTLELLQEGNTVPFIARYRKEATGNLTEDQIRDVEREYNYFQKLEAKKEETLNKIDEKGLLTDELRNKIMQANKLQTLDDIYLPFKEKKKTKATEAIKNGLEPLADFILNNGNNVEEEAKKYINDSVVNVEAAIEGALYIVAERISDNSEYRDKIRQNLWKFARLVVKKKKNAEEIDEKKVYEIYYDFSQAVNKLPSYRVLAINRAEKEKVVSVKFDYDDEYIANFLVSQEGRKLNDENRALVRQAVVDSLKRLILPSLQREIRKELTENADKQAIAIFSTNLNKLIMQSPLKNKWILGVDPAFRTGCKLAVVNTSSEMIEVDVIYPHPPVNKKKAAAEKLREIVAKYPIEQIVIGNGTASRETEEFVDELHLGVPYSLVSEAGASVYSASKVAQEEFPNLTVEYRSAVSIARRVQDPMAELVKIDPKSIGVGQYQHDVNQKLLSENLDFEMIKSINQVGVDLNTASRELLQYVSGLDKGLAKNIVDYRNEIGKYDKRSDLKKVKRLGAKAFTQSAGFLKILDGSDKLDATFIHPEDYKMAKEIIKHSSQEDRKYVLNYDAVAEIEGLTEAKYEEIINYLNKPNLDIRSEVETASFSRKIRKIEDLKVGDVVQGEVRNVVQFGAFVDIGLKNDALVHISELSNKFISDVEDVLSLGEIRNFRIKEIDIEKEKIQLSLKEL